LIGIGVTLAWQSYGDEAMQMVGTKAPSLAWLLPVSTEKPAGQWSNAAAASSPQLAQQLEVGLVQQVMLGLVTVRHNVEQVAIKVDQLAAKQEQLADKQDQMAQNIATLQSVEQEISKKLSSRAVAPRKPPQPAAQSSATPPATEPPTDPQ
jgi:outer membrane murein-binding lipoprotein Lpp